MTNNFKIGFIISIVVLVILIVSIVYIWNTKTQEIENLNTQITSLNSEIQSKSQEIAELDESKTQEIAELEESKNQEIAELDDSFKLVKFACLFSLQCTEEYNERLRQQFIQSKNLENTRYQSVATGQNYYKYFLDPQPDFPVKMREFIKANCPSQMHSTPGKLFSRYIYDINGNELSIVMDEETVDILCSWIYDKSADSYSQP